MTDSSHTYAAAQRHPLTAVRAQVFTGQTGAYHNHQGP